MATIDRRGFIGAAAAAFAWRAPASAAARAGDAAARIAGIEARSGGRLGVFARDLGSGRVVAYRAGERFPMCSTFKTLAVAATLQRVDAGRERLDRPIGFAAADILEYAPVTKAHLASGAMSVRELCAATMIFSDNTAANLLLRQLGGPAAVTQFVRANPFGDPVTRLDRTEPALNTAIAGDARDTTTPAHMVRDLTVLLDTAAVLSPESSHALRSWMRACRTGTTALRAGVPADWIAADKTGSGENATRNDVAYFQPPHRRPIVVAAYLTRAHALVDAAGRDAALADVARIVTAAFR